jgi:mannose-6-phosphate isomerase-like protein (cupin superfamily)
MHLNEPIRRASVDDEYFFEEGCYILELSNREDDPAVSIARARVPVGGSTRLHRLHGIGERYLILDGVGTVEVGGLAPERVLPGHVVVIPPGCPQRIINDGSVDLVFLAVCTPRFTRSAYEDLEGPPRGHDAAPQG